MCKYSRSIKVGPKNIIFLLVGHTNFSKVTKQEDRSMKQAAYFEDGTIAAWQRAGAKLGWLGINEELEMEFAEQPDRLKAAIPAFKFVRYVGDVIHLLPAPEIPFGLMLKNPNVKNTQPRDLTRFTNLQALDLSGTDVTDAGLKDLASLTHLQALSLSVTKVTDAGLKELARLTNLQRIDLTGTMVTHFGMNELQTKLPSCQIIKR